MFCFCIWRFVVADFQEMKHAARFGNGAYLAEDLEKSLLGKLISKLAALLECPRKLVIGE